MQPLTPHIFVTVPDIVAHGLVASKGFGAMFKSKVERTMKGPTNADCPRAVAMPIEEHVVPFEPIESRGDGEALHAAADRRRAQQ